MSQLGELIASRLNRIFPVLSMHRKLNEGLFTIETNQEWSYQEARNVAFAFEPYWSQLKGKRFLDIGTGLGGKQAFYLESGMQPLTGIDIGLDNVQSTQELVFRRGMQDSIHLAACDAAALPFPDDTFDGIVSINVFEHIMQVEAAVREAYRVIKPDGLVFLHLPPYYGPWSPHLDPWIHFPWPHLLFSDKTLMRVSKQEDDRTQINARFVKPAQMNWQKAGYQIPNVNKVTFRRFHQMVKKAGFTILQLKLLPIGYERAKLTNSLVEKLAWKMISSARHVPILREAIITKMIYVLTKKQDQ